MRHRRSYANRDRSTRDRGSIALIVAVAFLPLSMALAVVADGGRVWVEKHELQDSVESSALAVARDYALTGSVCSASALASIGGDASCSLEARANGAVVTVDSRRDVPLRFAGLFGRDTAEIDSIAAVRVGPAVSVTGLRPLALCQDNSALRSWMASDKTTSVTHTIEVEATESGCGGSVPGNWAMLDFNGGSNSTNETRDWVANGYADSVSTGTSLTGVPGIPSSSLRLDQLVGRSIVVPVFENPRLEGSNAVYDVVGFVGMRVVEVNLTGGAGGRSVVVVFERGVTSGSSGAGGDPDFGLWAWSVCSFERKGVCS